MLMIPDDRRAQLSTSAPDLGGGPDCAALYRLMTWLSPAFPVGSFAYSSGIEWAVEAGDVTDLESLIAWLSVMLDSTSFCDGVLFHHAYRAATARQCEALCGITELAAAYAPSRERHFETMAQGRAFMDTIRAAWPQPMIEDAMRGIDGPVAYPVAVAIAAAAHDVPLMPALHAFLHAQLSNWISAGARLVPLGQTDSQRALVRLEPNVAAIADRAIGATLEDLGGATFRADLASMRHETQYTRLFRS